MDFNAKALEMTQKAIDKSGVEGIKLVEADIFRYQPVRDFDYAIGSMVFHHFTNDEIHRLITHLCGFVRRALLINDLHRNLLNYLVCSILVIPLDREIRHDARLSIRRGFKPAELRTILQEHDPGGSRDPVVVQPRRGSRPVRPQREANESRPDSLGNRKSQAIRHATGSLRILRGALPDGAARSGISIANCCSNGPIRGRYIAVDEDEEICSQDPDSLIGRFEKHGRQIAAEAARKALDQAGLAPAQIEGLVVNTCTGYLCPGLSSYLMEDLGLPAYTSVLDLMGMGCGGAIPNLEAACRMIQSGAKKTVLCLSVEICSATFFRGPDPDLIVSNSIFADGAAAAVLQANLNGDTAGGLVRFLDFESVTLPEHRDKLRYTTQGGRLRNVLTRSVPVIGAKAVAQVTQRLLDRHGLTPKDISHWVVHPGGTQVLKAVEKHLDLTPETLRFSYEVFRDYGNMSSPSVMFVLSKVLREARPRPGEKALLISFGAGFTAFAALVEF